MTTAAALLGSVLALASCGGGDSNGDTQSTAPAQQPVALVVTGAPSRTTASAVTLRGTVSEGADVTVDGKPAALRGRRFRARVSLERGKNSILVEASKFGTSPAHASVHIRRVDPEPTTVEQPSGSGSTNPGQGANPCPPGEELITRMGQSYCGHLGPATPSQCPPGQVPVGSTGACGPPEDTPTP
jgi:hypothetical protein